MNNTLTVIYKCSNEGCSFEESALPKDRILVPDGNNGSKDLKIGDICGFCLVGTIFNNKLNEELDPIRYPTLVKYQPSQIWSTVVKLQEKYPDMTEQQCLLNLEMDLFERE